MADNTKEKQHLRTQEDILNDIEDANSIAGIIKKRSLDLFANLTNGKDLFVDDDIKTSLKNIDKRLDGTPTNILHDARAKYASLDADEARIVGYLPAGATNPQVAARTAQYGNELTAIRAEKKALEKITGTGGATGAGSNQLGERRKEYNKLSTAVDYFDLSKKINNIDVDLLTATTVVGRGSSTPANLDQDLHAQFKSATAGTNNPDYKLCDEQGAPIPESGGKYTVQIEGQTATLSGLTITGGRINLQNLTVSPTTLDFSRPLKLSINGTYKNVVSDVNLVCNKKFELKLNMGKPLNTQGARQSEIDAYNTTPLGGGHVIENRMTSIYEHKRARMERDAFFRALKDGDGAKLDGLNEDQKEDLYQRVRNTYRFPNQDPNGTILSGAAVIGLTNLNNFRSGPLSFRDWFTADDHESVKTPANIATQRAYRDYINNNLEDQIGKYFARRYDRVFNEDLDTNTFLKAQVTNYFEEIDRNKTDNDMHMNVDEDIHIGKDGNDRMHNKRRKILGMRIGRRDVNYMRFFSGSKKAVAEQTVNISTNTNPEDFNNPEPEKYSLNVEVSGKNSISTEIKIVGQEPFIIKDGNPASLIRDILRCPRIVNGKTRAHIAYSVIKSVIDMAKEKDISLLYRDPQTNHNMVIKTHEKNIIVEDQDEATNYGTNNRRITQVLFDYKLFENTNTFEGTNNRSLRRGIDALMVHFTSAMNQVHEKYRLSVENSRRTKTKLPTSILTSPIKKLLNARTTTKFDFETSVTGTNGKKVSISLKKNTFTVTGDGLKKPVKSKSLGKLLETRVGKMRIFDGVERDICGKVYEELVNNMRKNTKIARSNFGVLDPMTGRAYILDEDGQMGYVQAETIQKKNPIRRNNAAKIAGQAAVTGGLVAGGVALGGGAPAAIAATLAAGSAAGLISTVSPTLGAAAATATVAGGAGSIMLGAGAVSGFNMGQYLWRNANRKRGVVETPPQGRTICNESEKREVFKDPFLMSGIIRAMSERLGRL